MLSTLTAISVTSGAIDATLMLFEEGRFNLDDPVANYLPEMKAMKVWAGGTQDAPQLEALKRIDQEMREKVRPIRPPSTVVPAPTPEPTNP